MNTKILIYSAFLASTAHAYEPDRARSNLAHEFATCSAYYMLAGAVSKKQFPDLASKLEQTGVQANELSVAASNEKVAIARAQMATKDMLKDIDNDASNFSILINKYSDACQTAMNDPVSRLNYWMEKK